MRSLSRNLALATLVTVLSAPIYANEVAAKPAAQAAAPVAKPAASAQSSAPAAQTAPAQSSAEGVNVANAPAPAGKSVCEDVKAGIEAKIKAKGVKAFTLDIVGKDEAKDAKVVGNCEGGKKLITYKRG
jgi:hypothetical protein